MDKREKDPERRKQRRLERLGTNDPVCPGCGERDWRCFELHHIAGRSYDDIEAPFCNNCHAKLSDDQKDHPAAGSDNPSRLEIVGRFLLGIADFLALLILTLREFGAYLIEASQQHASPSLE